MKIGWNMFVFCCCFNALVYIFGTMLASFGARFLRFFGPFWKLFWCFLEVWRGIPKKLPKVGIFGSLLEPILAPRWAKLDAKWH